MWFVKKHSMQIRQNANKSPKATNTDNPMSENDWVRGRQRAGDKAKDKSSKNKQCEAAEMVHVYWNIGFSWHFQYSYIYFQCKYANTNYSMFMYGNLMSKRLFYNQILNIDSLKIKSESQTILGCAWESYTGPSIPDYTNRFACVCAHTCGNRIARGASFFVWIKCGQNIIRADNETRAPFANHIWCENVAFADL